MRLIASNVTMNEIATLILIFIASNAKNGATKKNDEIRVKGRRKR